MTSTEKQKLPTRNRLWKGIASAFFPTAAMATAAAEISLSARGLPISDGGHCREQKAVSNLASPRPAQD
jgi:hypothetical protein